MIFNWGEGNYLHLLEFFSLLNTVYFCLRKRNVGENVEANKNIFPWWKDHCKFETWGNFCITPRTYKNWFRILPKWQSPFFRPNQALEPIPLAGHAGQRQTLEQWACELWQGQVKAVGSEVHTILYRVALKKLESRRRNGKADTASARDFKSRRFTCVASLSVGSLGPRGLQPGSPEPSPPAWCCPVYHFLFSFFLPCPPSGPIWKYKSLYLRGTGMYFSEM